MQKHIALLGLKVQDKVTGLKGVVSTVSFDLYGCVQVVITPQAKDDRLSEGAWFDVNRLKILSYSPVMDIPNFIEGPQSEGDKGPAPKPLPGYAAYCDRPRNPRI
jgi:hypothetical protein